MFGAIIQEKYHLQQDQETGEYHVFKNEADTGTHFSRSVCNKIRYNQSILSDICIEKDEVENQFYGSEEEICSNCMKSL